MLNKATVIIPAHNRPERLRRLLAYYENTGIQILVSDSSREKYTGPINAETTTYVHQPNTHFLIKIRDVLHLIKTPYVLYCADDDFAVPEAIEEIICFLEQNEDYTVAQGHYLTFTPYKNKVKFLPRYIRNFNSRITNDNPIERLHGQCGVYASLLYGVARTENFKRIYSHCFDDAGELRFNNLFLAEEYFQNAMLIEGKYATLPYFYSARERIKGSATSTTVPSSVIKTRPEHALELSGYILALSELLSLKTGMTLDEAKSEIQKIITAPADTPAVMFKRRVNTWLSKSPLLYPLTLMSEWRYAQKGLNAVKGMQSYPCTFSTPEREKIEKFISY